MQLLGVEKKNQKIIYSIHFSGCRKRILVKNQLSSNQDQDLLHQKSKGHCL